MPAVPAIPIRSSPLAEPSSANPGTICAEEYAVRKTSDAICIFENDRGFEQLKPPAWMGRANVAQAAVLLHRVSTTNQMRRSLRTAIDKNIAFVFITDDHGANPWDRLPSYWPELVKELGQLNSQSSRSKQRGR